MKMKVGIILVFLLATSLAMAASAVKPISLDVSQPGLAGQKETVLRAIESDLNCSEIVPADREKIKQTLVLLVEKLPDDASFSMLKDEERTQVLSQQKLINELLAKAAKDSKIICRDEDVSGSHLPRKVCRTRAAHRLFAEQQREELDRSMNGSNRINTKVSDSRSSN